MLIYERDLQGFLGEYSFGFSMENVYKIYSFHVVEYYLGNTCSIEIYIY